MTFSNFGSFLLIFAPFADFLKMAGNSPHGGAYLPGIKGRTLGGKVMGSKSSPAPGKPPPWGELPAIFKESAKGSKNEQNEPKLEKVNKSQLSGNEKSTKVNSRENLPNIETNSPQVTKMRKEAPKSKFNRFKVLKTERFRENNLRGTLENAYRAQI